MNRADRKYLAFTALEFTRRRFAKELAGAEKKDGRGAR